MLLRKDSEGRQAIDVRRIRNTGKLAPLFFCSQCQKLRWGNLHDLSGKTIREFLCKDCPEYEPNPHEFARQDQRSPCHKPFLA